jgi:hypothetical protein
MHLIDTLKRMSDNYKLSEVFEAIIDTLNEEDLKNIEGILNSTTLASYYKTRSTLTLHITALYVKKVKFLQKAVFSVRKVSRVIEAIIYYFIENENFRNRVFQRLKEKIKNE